MKEEDNPYKMTHYRILSHYYLIYYCNLTFDGNTRRSNCLENDGSREPLQKSKQTFFRGFDIIVLVSSDR